MLPPGTIVLDNNPFFFFDLKKTNNNSSMNTTHYHNFYEIYLLLSGSCEYLINDKIYSISECSMLFVPAGEVHKTTYTSLHCERILLSFNDLIFDKYLSQELQKPLFYKLKENDPILDLFNKMSKITDFKSVKNQILITSYLNVLLIYMMEHHKDIAKLNIKTPSVIDHVLSYISENFYEDIALKDLSAQFGYSADHFSKLFKEFTGSTFKEYLMLTRFTAAEKLLLTTNKSVTDIALSCGFNDSNYFSYMFNKRYGVSPLRYKKIKNSL